MQHSIVKREPTPVVGFQMVTTAFNPEIGAAWGRVHQNGDFQRLMAKSQKMENFGLCIMEEGLPEGSFRYMIACDLAPGQQPDADMERYTVAGGDYAVFHCQSMETISDTFRYIYGEWLPTSTEYANDTARNADFEYYSMDGSTVNCDIYVPIARK